MTAELSNLERLALPNRKRNARSLLPNAKTALLGNLWHTIREGAPWSAFRDVELYAEERGEFSEVACATMGDRLHVCATTTDGKLWHSIRDGGPWTPFRDVSLYASDPGPIDRVSAASMGNRLHVLAITNDRVLWHSIREGNPWTPFVKVSSYAGDIGEIVAANCAVIQDALHVCAVHADGRLFHSIRKGVNWSPFTDVAPYAGDKGRIVAVSMATAGDKLHVLATGEDGRLWHSIRQGNPWTLFEPVTDPANAGTPEVSTIAWSAAATEASMLHVCAVDDNGGMFHSIRGADGKWTSFADVELEAQEVGLFGRVACAFAGSRLHVCGVATTNAATTSVFQWPVKASIFVEGESQPIATVQHPLELTVSANKARFWLTGTRIDIKSVYGDGTIMLEFPKPGSIGSETFPIMTIGAKCTLVVAGLELLKFDAEFSTESLGFINSSGLDLEIKGNRLSLFNKNGWLRLASLTTVSALSQSRRVAILLVESLHPEVQHF